MLIGREYTRLSDEFLQSNKEYRGKLCLGVSTDTYDREGEVTNQSDFIPKLKEVQTILKSFQGTISQIPPMYSAKKINGKKLYDLARKGVTIERQPIQVEVEVELIDYSYPNLEIQVNCSKGTYIRTIAHDIGNLLGCGAHLFELKRIRSGGFHIDECISQELLKTDEFNPLEHLRFS